MANRSDWSSDSMSGVDSADMLEPVHDNDKSSDETAGGNQTWIAG